MALGSPKTAGNNASVSLSYHAVQRVPEWQESPDGVSITLPPPSKRQAEFVSLAVLQFIALLICALLTVAGLIGVVEGAGIAPIMLFLIGGGLTVLMVRHLLSAARERRETASAPSVVIRITTDEFRIERAGKEQELDVSWTRAEMTDVRLQASPSLKLGLVQAACDPDDRVRCSVELTSGKVEDTIFLAEGRDWINELETRLRSQLGFQP